MSKVTPAPAGVSWVTAPNLSVCLQTCSGGPGKPNGGRLAGASAPRVAELGTLGPPGGVASSPRPRLLARRQASPASPPCYKRRDRGAPASLRQQPAGRAGFRRVPVRLPAAASVTPVSGADGRRREPWELQPSRSRQVWGAWVGAGTTAPPLAPAQTLGPGLGVRRSARQRPARLALPRLRPSAGRSGDNATGDSGGSALEVPAGDRAPGAAPPRGHGSAGGGGSRAGLGAARG